MTAQTNRHTQKATHSNQNSRQLTDKFRHMNTGTCPSTCQHIHTLRSPHKAPSNLPISFLLFGFSSLSSSGVFLLSYPERIPLANQDVMREAFRVPQMRHCRIEPRFLDALLSQKDLCLIECSYLPLHSSPFLLRTPKQAGCCCCFSMFELKYSCSTCVFKTALLHKIFVTLVMLLALCHWH